MIRTGNLFVTQYSEGRYIFQAGRISTRQNTIVAESVLDSFLYRITGRRATLKPASKVRALFPLHSEIGSFIVKPRVNDLYLMVTLKLRSYGKTT